ncbi:piggyBac transposable element-derived protein 4-like [Stegodyphus dumicola]|uniref:piggyBac transposable element-derived protein 4-like n=1 Tax=Stegodyphus dumicola TaxID=202533 RepID=UPI0015AE568E|nr:piggyBac transposable element-derived protein 4-like [Stegodyphus dumicola]
MWNFVTVLDVCDGAPRNHIEVDAAVRCYPSPHRTADGDHFDPFNFVMESRVFEVYKVSSAFKLFIHDDILLHIKKCTESEAHRQLGNKDWTLSLADLDALVAILYVRGVIGSKGLDLYPLWSEVWGIPFCKETISRDGFKKVKRFLRFDEKTTRSTRLQTDKFALASDMWDKFIESCKTGYRPGQNITVDEQLFPSKARCRFTRYMPNKPEKFGIIFGYMSKLILNTS